MVTAKQMIFHGLELNAKMQKMQTAEEMKLFSYVRSRYANRILRTPEHFERIVADIRTHINEINELRAGIGPYLNVEAFAPTDITFGWIRIHHVTAKSQARISICTTEGDITFE